MSTEVPLGDVLSRVRVDPAACRAVVADEEVEAPRRGELEPRLAERIYAVFHAGLSTDPADKAQLKRDRPLEQVLAGVVPHARTPVTGVLRRDDRDRLLVELSGVLVWLPREALDGDPVPADEPVRLLLPPVRPCLSPGFQFVTGSRAPDFTGPPLRVYVHVADPGSAPGVWRAVLTALEAADVAYQAKVLARSGQYPRRDALVVYLPADHTGAARLVAAAVRELPGIGPETSVFAERIAPGVATAWEPVDTRFGLSGLSFGQHRSRVLAKALLDAAETGQPPEEAIVPAFRAARIDPANPARNLGQDG
ncbi:T3SS effector HopA1 family protein [Amycolatopsis sacchari]|uniref:T3SS effector HopA1 family protein n=1 Tax=Amycolatopsis sacchari TaxID=115433 RepID=UPI001177FDC0|nr:T3SS effector HopA1 family protein [Amycolatopsis sacchari]